MSAWPFSFRYTPMCVDVAVIADEHFGDLSDGAQLILHADDDAAALFTVAEDLQKGIEYVVLGQDPADLSVGIHDRRQPMSFLSIVMAASSMSASSWMVTTLRIMIVSTVVLDSR